MGAIGIFVGLAIVMVFALSSGCFLSRDRLLSVATTALARGELPHTTRTNEDLRRLMLGFRDTVLFGDQGNPYLLNAYLQFRREPSVRRPAHLEEGLPSTFVNLFSSLTTGGLFGDITQELVGPGFTPLMLDQNYLSSGMNLFKRIGRHDLKFGWDLQLTHVDGAEATNIFDLLFATVPDFEQFGLANSGVRTTFGFKALDSKPTVWVELARPTTERPRTGRSRYWR